MFMFTHQSDALGLMITKLWGIQQLIISDSHGQRANPLLSWRFWPVVAFSHLNFVTGNILTLVIHSLPVIANSELLLQGQRILFMSPLFTVCKMLNVFPVIETNAWNVWAARVNITPCDARKKRKEIDAKIFRLKHEGMLSEPRAPSRGLWTVRSWERRVSWAKSREQSLIAGADLSGLGSWCYRIIWQRPETKETYNLRHSWPHFILLFFHCVYINSRAHTHILFCSWEP